MIDIVLLAHGSPDPRHRADVEHLAVAADSLAPDLAVRVAYLDHHDPTPRHVGTILANQGTDEIVVVPVLLSDAYHARSDIPRAAAQLAETSGRGVVLADALGPHPALAVALDELLATRVETKAVLYLAGGARHTATSDLADLLVDALPSRTAAAASLDGHLSLAQAIERLGGPADVVAVPVVIARGVLHDRMGERCREHGIPMIGAALASTGALADHVVTRVRESMPPRRS